MDPKEALERLKEIEEVPADVVKALEASPLRKQLTEWETRWRDEAEPALDYKAKHESLPKRKEALKRVGVDYDAEKPYGRKTLDSIPADKLDDLEFVANFVKEEGFEASLKSEGDEGEKSGAAEITDFLSAQGDGTPPRTDKNAEMHKALEAAKSEEEAAKILAAHGQLDSE